MTQSQAQLDRINEMMALKALICREVSTVADRRLGRLLRAIILTGSLARNEATFTRGEVGHRVLGDCDLLLLFKEGSSLPAAAVVEGICRSVETNLRQQGLECQVGASAIHSRFLTSLKPHILAFELREHGEVIWGDANSLALIPGFLAKDIPLEDGWRVLCNRLIELLECLTGFGAETGPESAYRTVKLYLDMGTSLLLFLQRYRSTYEARARELECWAREGHDDLPFGVDEFVKNVRVCTDWKLDPGGTLPPVDWQDAISYARLLFRWELGKMTSSDSHTTDEQLGIRWSSKQPFVQRLRGWAYVVRAMGLSGFGYWMRWARMAQLGSPRNLVYRAAAGLCFQMPALHPERSMDLDATASLLPVLRTSSGNWRDLATDIAWNYHHFLIGTRA